MSGSGLISAEELLKKGLEKSERTLPVKGPKDVTPTGSWIEEKQIQEALESRKQLLSDERVEKWGILSRAEWDSARGLARVIEKRGGHWNYLSHAENKQIYLNPEEALFLIEMNALELKYCGLPVSLQQAYSLLLKGPIGILQYKVYSELSRVGYRVLRTNVKAKGDMKDGNATSEGSEKKAENGESCLDNNFDKCQENVVNDILSKDTDVNMDKECDNELIKETNSNKDGMTSVDDKDNADITLVEMCEKDVNEKIIIENKENVKGDLKEIEKNSNTLAENDIQNNYTNKDILEINLSGKDYIEILTSSDKKLVDTSNKNDQKVDTMISKDDIAVIEPEKDDVTMTPDDNIPVRKCTDWRTNPIVIVTKKPEQENNNIDRTVNKGNANKTKSLNSFSKNRLRLKSLSSLQLPDFFQCIPDLISVDNVTVMPPEEEYLPRHVFLHKTEYDLKLDSIRSKERPNNKNLNGSDQISGSQMRNPIREAIIQQQMMRPIFFPPFLRFINFNPKFGNAYVNPFVQFPFVHYQNMLKQNSFRMQTIPPNVDKKVEHLQAIRNITARLRKLKKSGIPDKENYMDSLKKLMVAFNERYGEKLELTDNLTLRNDCFNVDTVNIEDDEQPKRKRQQTKTSDIDESVKTLFLERIKVMAVKLKQIRDSGERCFRNRRSLIDAIKQFNKKFNMSINLTPDFEIMDSKQIVLDSSSDSDCVVTENTVEKRRTKRRKNLDNSTTIQQQIPSTLVKQTTNEEETQEPQSFHSLQSYNFLKWLPDLQDWGRPEVTRSVHSHHRLVNNNQEILIYNYLHGLKNVQFKDWSHLKYDFWAMIEKNRVEIAELPQEVPQCGTSSLLLPEDCIDLPTALEKVRVVKTHSPAELESTLNVTFDVYERDVKNFKKKDAPVPSFRVVCLDERCSIPDMSEVLALQQRYGDSAPVLLAVVGATVSYVLVKSSNLPVYVKNSFI